MDTTDISIAITALIGLFISALLLFDNVLLNRKISDKLETRGWTELRLLVVLVSALILHLSIPVSVSLLSEERSVREELHDLSTRLDASLGVLDHLDEEDLYDVDEVNKAGLTKVRMYVPAGLTDLRDEAEYAAKIEWIRAIQERQRGRFAFNFEAVYGVPPWDSPYFDEVACLLAEFTDAKTSTVRLFRAWPAEDPRPAAPGIGIMIGGFGDDEDKNFVLFGAATDPRSVRIDEGINTRWQESYETFDEWFGRYFEWFDKNLGRKDFTILPLANDFDSDLRAIVEVAGGRPEEDMPTCRSSEVDSSATKS